MNGGETHINNGQNHMVNLISCGMPDYHQKHKMHNHFLIASPRKRISFAKHLSFLHFWYWFLVGAVLCVFVCVQVHSELNRVSLPNDSVMVSQRNRKKFETHRPFANVQFIWLWMWFGKGEKQGGAETTKMFIMNDINYTHCIRTILLDKMYRI